MPNMDPYAVRIGSVVEEVLPYEGEGCHCDIVICAKDNEDREVLLGRTLEVFPHAVFPGDVVTARMAAPEDGACHCDVIYTVVRPC